MRTKVAATLGALLLASNVAAATGSEEPNESGEREAQTRVAVLPLRVENLKLNDVQRLNALVRARAETRGGLRVQAEETTHGLVDGAQALGIDCDLLEESCASRLGRIADVAFVVAGSAVGLGDEVGVELRFIDVSAGKQRRRVIALVPRDPDAQLEPINALFERLFDERLPLAALLVEAEPAGSSLAVDGVPVGSLPLEGPVGGLVPGEHLVAVQKKGYLPAQARLSLGAGEPFVHTLRLEVDPATREPPPGPIALTLPWVAVGASALVAVAGGALTAAGAMPWMRFQDTEGRLSSLDATAASYPEQTAALRQESAAAAEEWNQVGQQMTAAGVAALGLGIAGAAGGVVWGVLVTSRLFESDAE